MTNLTETNMTKLEEGRGSNARRVLWIALAGLGTIFMSGAIIGFLSQHQADGGGAMSAIAFGILALFIMMTGALAFIIWHNIRQLNASGEQMTTRERLNNRIIVAFSIVGGLIGIIVAISGNFGSQPTEIFSNGPISPVVAIGLAVVIGLLLPPASWYWHMRVIDEQEAQAYRSGTLLALYAFWIVAPIWWLLWRGGLVPAPDGVALYLMTTFIALIVWLYEKYR